MQQELQKYSIYFEVEGSKALFTDPVSRIGKEKNSYPVPTQSALIGICSNIYWKPTIAYQITECRVMNEIQYEAMNKLVPHFYDDKRSLNLQISQKCTIQSKRIHDSKSKTTRSDR